MTVRQIELFCLVYERRNLTQTAGVLYMTQSAVTQNLRKLEEELGVRLFERNSRQLSPSRAGESFYPHAKKILAEYRDALDELAAVGEHLTFRYYAASSTAIKDRIISFFWEKDPLLEITQIDCRIGELLDNNRWASGTLYLVPEEFISDPSVHAIEAAAVQHFIIMRENHPLSEKSLVRPEDLAGETLLLRSDRVKQFSHLSASLDLLREKGIPYQIAVADQARELVPKILSFGGLAILPEYLTGEVPGIVKRPYADGIRICVCLAYKGSLSPRVMKLLSAYQKKYGHQGTSV